MLSSQSKTITFYDKFYRVACDPLYLTEINEFYDDIDKLAADVK